MENIASLEKKLKVKFKNKEVLQQALVHRSYINENPGFHLGHNERLEFLGDAVLELVVTEFLYTTSITRNMDIEEFLYLSRGESKDRDSKARSYILANAFEAIVGAIYMDRGYKEAKIFIERHVLTELPNILKNHLYLDPKSKFQEISQEKFGITPTYSVISESGPDHNKKFKVGLYLEDELVATSDGSSKREAQERAAAEGLKAKGWE